MPYRTRRAGTRRVALLAEGVDWNLPYLSIEVAHPCRPPRGGRGLKYRGGFRHPWIRRRPPRGGRGLKCFIAASSTARGASPSSRRAWIEIAVRAHRRQLVVVALLAEGVD